MAGFSLGSGRGGEIARLAGQADGGQMGAGLTSLMDRDTAAARWIILSSASE